MKRLRPDLVALERMPLRLTDPPRDIFLDEDDTATVVFETHVMQYATLGELLGALGLRREHLVEIPVASPSEKWKRA